MSMGPVFSFRTPCLSLVKVSRDYTPVLCKHCDLGLVGYAAHPGPNKQILG